MGGQTGWVVGSDSVADLKKAILEAVSHPQKARQFAESGRLRFDERFTREKMLQGYRRIYAEMLNGAVN
jgi:glycosyltransferase involved in cell wall biosynthesis